MKKAFIISIFILFLTGFVPKSQISAQGTCTCGFGPAGCNANENKCASGYAPQCGNVCKAGTPHTCSCVPYATAGCGIDGLSCCNPGLKCFDGSVCRGGLGGFTCVIEKDSRITNVCTFAGDKKKDCDACFLKDPPEVWTAIGCIPTTPTGFIKKFLNFAVGIAGGIAFLLILVSGFQILTSAGNPEKLTAGKELLSAAVSGLILIIFSIFLLQLIGFTILGIPGFR